MNSDTFVRIAGLLKLTNAQIAEESGYSPATIQAVSAGYRNVSGRLEAYILRKLAESKDEEAVRYVLKHCSSDGSAVESE